MKRVSSLSLFVFGIAVLVFTASCREATPVEPKEDMPEKVGRWKKGSVSASNNYSRSVGERHPNFRSMYSVEEGSTLSGDKGFVDYNLDIFKNADEAASEQKEKGGCLDGAWKTGPLVDKGGQSVGTMSICRKTEGAYSGTKKDYLYTLIFNNGNRLVELKTSAGENVELIEFAKALPFNSQVDLSMLESLRGLENLNTAELMKISPPVRIAKEAYLKGKVVVISTSEIQTMTYFPDDNRRAETVNEMQSLVQIRCEKAEKIGQYEMIESKKLVPAYGSKCKVTVIDNTIPAIIAEKSFVNKEMPDFQTFYTSLEQEAKGKVTEYVAPSPDAEIKAFITGLPIR